MASLAVDIPLAQATSPDQSHTIAARNSYQRDDWRRLQLNDAVEDALSKILRFGYDIDRIPVKPATAKSLHDQIVAWAKHIAVEIPGYTNWQQIYDFTRFDTLYMPDAVPGEDPTHVGTEAELVVQLQDIDLERAYALQSKAVEKEDLADHALSLHKARTRQDILDNIAARYTAINPMPAPLASLFRKIRYTYKLRECLLGDVGYHNGSLEFAADMEDDFEYHMYLIHMKLRRPDRLHAFKAPKAMAYYRTDTDSPLPWNNQFSFSYKYDEFGPQQIPVFGINYIERKLVEVLRLDNDGKKWHGLCVLLGWHDQDPAHAFERNRIKTEFTSAETAASVGLRRAAGHFLGGNLTLADCGFRFLTLPHIISCMSYDETKRKAFYTLFLGLTWSDTPLRKEENPFAELYEMRVTKSLHTGTPIDYDLAHLKDNDVKDPRIAADRPALLTLNVARYYPQVVSRKANFILTPETAGTDYRRKLQRLSEDQLDTLFSNITTYPRDANLTYKIEAVVDQAVQAARDWHARAVEHHRPIYTGPSGHMLSYSRIFLDNVNCEGCAAAHHPTLEQLRVTLLAGLIGFNQHHTYDECMVASHGLTHGDQTLQYMDRIGYRDIIDSADSFVRNKVGQPLLEAIRAIANQFIAYFEEYQAALVPPLPHPAALVTQWFTDTTGRTFAPIKAE